MDITSIQNAIEQNSSDFVSCLLENLQNHNESYRKFLKDLGERPEFMVVSPGCKAARLVYLALTEENA